MKLYGKKYSGPYLEQGVNNLYSEGFVLLTEKIVMETIYRLKKKKQSFQVALDWEKNKKEVYRMYDSFERTYDYDKKLCEWLRDSPREISTSRPVWLNKDAYKHGSKYSLRWITVNEIIYKIMEDISLNTFKLFSYLII